MAEDLGKLLTDLQTLARQRKLYRYKPYPFQREFHDAGAEFSERMLMAANRIGKTECAAAEVAFHLTGDYPEWWEGRRFDGPILAWLGSVTNEASRDIVQKALLGGTAPSEIGTGYIPKANIYGRPQMRQAGISDVVDQIKVRHKAGGLSLGVFKSYDQGWRKWQGTAPHVVWLDEEPEEYKLFTECETRILTSKGVLLVTFTPLLGETDLVRHFTEGTPGTWLKGATWDDAPHLSTEEKTRFRALFPPWEVDARTRGIPMMGEGRVFSISEDDIKCEPFELKPWQAQIIGIDFGIDHPAAGVRMAWDRDSDCLYVVDCYRQKNETAVYHAARLKAWGPWIPVAWPHDGMNREKSGGQTLAQSYEKHGANMLGMSARYDNDKGGSQAVEPIVLEIFERMRTGRFKVFSHLSGWFEEFRGYHRKDGKIVAVKDDLLKATFYAVMMRRYARVGMTQQRRGGYAAPVISTSV